MDTIQVEGVLYTKASLLAKNFRYTTDYIGQLCRAGKVDCQLVGRAWYVAESSLLKHKDARYKEVRVNEKTIKSSTILKTSDEAISVTPRLKRVTAKQLSNPNSHFLSRLGASSSKYFVDDTELLPQPLRQSSAIKPIVPMMPEKIVVEPAETTSIKISASTKPEKLVFTELPEVALRGKLTLTDVEIKEDIAPVTLEEVERVNVPLAQPKAHRAEVVARPVGPTVATKMPPRSFTPQQVTTAESKPRTGFLVPLALVASLVLFLFTTVSTQQFVIEGSDVSASIFFSLEGLRELF